MTRRYSDFPSTPLVGDYWTRRIVFASAQSFSRP